MRPTLMFPALGILLIVLASPLAARRVLPNRWYGLRVLATFADEQVWYEANAVAGRHMVALHLRRHSGHRLAATGGTRLEAREPAASREPREIG